MVLIGDDNHNDDYSKILTMMMISWFDDGGYDLFSIIIMITMMLI